MIDVLPANDSKHCFGTFLFNRLFVPVSILRVEADGVSRWSRSIRVRWRSVFRCFLSVFRPRIFRQARRSRKSIAWIFRRMSRWLSWGIPLRETRRRSVTSLPCTRIRCAAATVSLGDRDCFCFVRKSGCFFRYPWMDFRCRRFVLLPILGWRGEWNKRMM